jgi:L-lactate utilization protein LutC
LFDLVFACSLPALETSLDMARMKLDKAKLDEVTEHEEAEAAMKVTETYCDEMVVYSGDQTIAQHGLEDIANTKTDLWSDHNETIEQLKHEKKNEIIRKVQLAQLEVELHQKIGRAHV